MTKPKVQREKVVKEIERDRALFIRLFGVIALSITITACGNSDSVKFSSGERVMSSVEILDTAQIYDIDIYARVPDIERELMEIPLQILITSPSGECYEDTIELPLRSSINVHKLYMDSYIDYRWRYRKGVRFPIKGTWHIEIKQRFINRRYIETDKIGIETYYGKR